MTTGQSRIDRLTQMIGSGTDQQGRPIGAGRMEALKARLQQLQGQSSGGAADLAAGTYRTANGQTIPIRLGLAPNSVYNQYIAANPAANPAMQRLLTAQAATQARIAAGQAAHQINMQNTFGHLLTPENLAALGMNPQTTAGQLTNEQISALARVGAGQQIAGQVAATDEAGQAALAEGGRWAGPVPQAGGIVYGNPVPEWWSQELASQTAPTVGAPVVTPEVYAARRPDLAPGLLDYYRRAYEAALARYTAGGV